MLSECPWTEAALAKLQNVPYFARLQARQRIEAVARHENCPEITAELVERVRLENGQ
ncbi:MAG: protochlorophyllide oxidoreductase [Oscillatoriales cyanobacterium SM2_1_8]|nr:protochlorophyllide oxidoreductase [Oscillatoriales cyanobacterium SM2_1_8]